MHETTMKATRVVTKVRCLLSGTISTETPRRRLSSNNTDASKYDPRSILSQGHVGFPRQADLLELSVLCRHLLVSGITDWVQSRGRIELCTAPLKVEGQSCDGSPGFKCSIRQFCPRAYSAIKV